MTKIIRAERGSSIMEFSLCLPILYLLFAGVIDVTNLVVTYMQLSQVANEGVRMLSGMPALNPNVRYWSGSNQQVIGTQIPAAAFASCTTATANNAYPCGHAMAHERIDDLVKIFLQMRTVDPNSITVQTEYFPGTAGVTQNNDDTVWLKVSIDFTGLFPPFERFRMSAQGQGVYLYGS